METEIVTARDVKRAEHDYQINKLEYNYKKAELWLKTNWEEELGPKPSQKDKEYYIERELYALSKKKIISETEYHYLARLYNEQQRGVE